MKLSDIASGYKTHAVVIGAIGVIWFSFAGGDMDLATAIQNTLTALGLSTLRIAVAKK